MAIACMMAKAPVAGEVKTRLCPPLSPARAATLAAAFIDDTWAALQRLPELTPVLVFAGPREAFGATLAGATAWPQANGDLGQRMADVLRRGLALDDMVLIVGADSPGLPAQLLQQALRLLDTADVVLGPCDDGGYYLLGSRVWRPGMLDELPWSSADTLAATAARMTELGWRVAYTGAWFDVDDEADLRRLAAALAAGELTAPATARCLEAGQWP